MILALILACHRGDDSGDDRVIPPAYDPPDLIGPWAIGTATRAVPGGDGSLPVQVWYPTTTTDGASAADYGVYGTGAALDETTPDCDELRPVVVFSHMSGGSRLDLLALAERLASHGAVVAAPDHVGNTLDDLDLDALSEVILRRPSDLAATFVGLPAADSALADCVDPAAGYGVLGHDLGATSALMAAGAPLDMAALSEACDDGDSATCALVDAWQQSDTATGDALLSDSRVWGVVAIAPTAQLTYGVTTEALAVPALLLGGDRDTSSPWDEVTWPLFEAIPSTPRGAGAVKGAGHLSFTQTCTFSPNYAECGDGYTSPETVRTVSMTLAVPFLLGASGDDKAYEFLTPEEDEVYWRWVQSR